MRYLQDQKENRGAVKRAYWLCYESSSHNLTYVCAPLTSFGHTFPHFRQTEVDVPIKLSLFHQDLSRADYEEWGGIFEECV